MPKADVSMWTREDYEEAAREYMAGLPLEHFMESTPHSTQREITLESLALVRARRPDVVVCNELLVQYPLNGDPGRVCPDNMVVLSPIPLGDLTSFNPVFDQPAHILWTLEYVSPSNKRKDYEDNYRRYRDELKVPYYLIFDPETKDLRLYHHNGFDYESVAPNHEGRLGIPELEVEVAVFDGWARYWLKGELLRLPAELQEQMEVMQQQLRRAERFGQQEKRRADAQERRADAQEQRAEEERRKAEEERGRAEEEAKRAEQASRMAEQAGQELARERLRAEQAEAELRRLRDLLAQGGGPPVAP